MNTEIVNLILTKDLNMKKVCAKTEPTNLSGRQKRKFLRPLRTITGRTHPLIRGLTNNDLGLPVCPRNKIPKYPMENYSISKTKRCVNVKIKGQNQTDLLYS